LNPDIEILLRTHSEAESELLRKDKLGTVFLAKRNWPRG
jgi:CPA2 family monovalent cation:H+ antiporter-2